MKKKLFALLVGSSLVLAACGGNYAEKDKGTNGGGDVTDTANAGDAQKMFTQKCSSCHGQNLEGGVGPNLTKVGTKYSKEDIEKIIAEGKGGMPPKQLEGNDASQVAEWLAGHK